MSYPATYTAAVDWDNDGAFTTTGEDVTSRLLAETPIQIARGRDQVRQLAPPMVGTADFELWNVSKNYSPDSTSGPLYGSLLPGRLVQITALESTTTYNLFKGYLDDIQLHPELPRRSATLPCLGTLSKLRGQSEGQKVSTQLYQNIATNEALGYILDAIGLSTTLRNISTGKTMLDWWWLDNEDAFSAAVAILNSEGPGAALYEDGQGRIVFENRHNRITATRCTVSQSTFYAADTEPMHSEPFSYQSRWKDVINACTVTQRTRQTESLQKVWQLDNTVTLSPNEARSFDARLGDPFTAAVCSTAGPDYTVSAGSLASVSLNRTSGQSCTITLTAGPSGATVTGLQLRAQPVTVSGETKIQHTISSTASQAKYGIHTYDLSVRAEIALNTLQDFANAVVAWYKEPRPVAEITIVGASTQRLEQVLTREIGDRVTVQEGQTGLSADCHIEQIKHEIAYGGRLHSAHFGVERASATKYFVLDSSVLDGSDVLSF